MEIPGRKRGRRHLRILSAKIEELQIPVQLVLEQEKEEPSDPSHEELHPF